MFTREQLRSVFAQRYGLPPTGSVPRLWQRFDYFPADVYYEAVVSSLAPGSLWLDVGGGSSPFPHNSALAAELVSRSYLVAVDPSPNVQTNSFASETYQMPLEQFATLNRFDLITARMVCEHVTDPAAFIRSLSRLIRPGGHVVIYTVSRFSPLSIAAALTPTKVHHLVKSRLWKAEEKDTFPTVYRMNTRQTLRRLFAAEGFAERLFLRLDDLALLHRFPLGTKIELTLWQFLRRLHLGYPECCLLGVYQDTL